MAEGGGDFGYDDPRLDHDLDHDDKDDDDSDQEVNRTQPFHPTEASTPYHHEEEHEMHKQSGLPDTSYEETPLLGDQSEMQKSWDALTRIFPRASATDLETSYSNKGRLQVNMFGVGKKLYNLFTKDTKTGKQRLNPSLRKEIKNSLGESAEEIIAEDRDTLQEQRQRLVETERQQREAEKIAAEKQKEEKEMQNLKQQINRTFERITALEEQQGSNLESEAELQRLKQLKKNFETDLENKKKEIAALEKIAKKKEKAQRKVEREPVKFAEKERERNLIEERLNSSPLMI